MICCTFRSWFIKQVNRYVVIFLLNISMTFLDHSFFFLLFVFAYHLLTSSHYKVLDVRLFRIYFVFCSAVLAPIFYVLTLSYYWFVSCGYFCLFPIDLLEK